MVCAARMQRIAKAVFYQFLELLPALIVRKANAHAALARGRMVGRRDPGYFTHQRVALRVFANAQKPVQLVAQLVRPAGGTNKPPP